MMQAIYKKKDKVVARRIADEMLGFIPVLMRVLYTVLASLTDVFVTPKVVQVLAFAIPQ